MKTIDIISIAISCLSILICAFIFIRRRINKRQEIELEMRMFDKSLLDYLDKRGEERREEIRQNVYDSVWNQVNSSVWDQVKKDDL